MFGESVFSVKCCGFNWQLSHSHANNQPAEAELFKSNEIVPSIASRSSTVEIVENFQIFDDILLH